MPWKLPYHWWSSDETDDADNVAREVTKDFYKHDVMGDCGCRWPQCPICNKGQIPKNDVLCVALGAWCGVSQCLRGMNLRSIAYPFDWNRVSLEGVVHFIQTDFSDFLDWEKTQEFKWDTHNGGLTFCGKYHSFWHDDLTKQEVTDKYERRITRFLETSEKKVLFIRACNHAEEVAYGKTLLQLLQSKFQESEVWLLVIVDHQPAAKSYNVEGTNGRLLLHLTDKRHLRTALYYDDVKAYEEAVNFGIQQVRATSKFITASSFSNEAENTSQSKSSSTSNVDSISNVGVIKNLGAFSKKLEQFYCGDPTCETWDPHPATEPHPVNFPKVNRTLHCDDGRQAFLDRFLCAVCETDTLSDNEDDYAVRDNSKVEVFRTTAWTDEEACVPPVSSAELDKRVRCHQAFKEAMMAVRQPPRALVQPLQTNSGGPSYVHPMMLGPLV